MVDSMKTVSLNGHNDTSHSCEPIKLGMKFDSDEDGFNYYNEYAANIGFSVRKEYVNKSKAHGYITSRRFTCYKESYRGKDKFGPPELDFVTVRWSFWGLRIEVLVGVIVDVAEVHLPLLLLFEAVRSFGWVESGFCILYAGASGGEGMGRVMDDLRWVDGWVVGPE
ncbi:hypothetical protein BC332_25916 [Capsicum chinense]|nr:hypothetical protein BC332_25916 [Capsicum chinense]